jgi:protocatechuate 3,4-dioxygenase alpha subunit
MINAPVSQRDWSSHPPLIYPAYASTVLRGPTKPLIPLAHGLAEATGPLFGHESVAPLDADLTRNARRNGEPLGERIVVTGRVLDEDGRPVRNSLIEIWQANAAGKYAHPGDHQPGKEVDPNFRGWGRSCTDFDNGVYTFETIKPGVVTGRNGRFMAPHINVWVVARGINLGLNTRLYFSDEAEANAKDAVLGIIEWEARRATLVAKREDKGGQVVYRFDIRLQGEGETVFFDI